MNNDKKNENEDDQKPDDQPENELDAQQDEPAAEEQPAEPAPKLDLATAVESPEEVVAWLKANGTPILVGVFIAALAFTGVSMYRNHQKAAEITAQSMLFSSQNAQQFSDIVARYPDAPATALAQLSLASQQFEDGQYDLAKSTFADFARKYPTHSLKAAADLGLAQCDEATLKLGDALKGYEAFAKAQTNHFLTAQAMFGRGRCLEQMGRYEEARQLYEDYVAGHGKEDPWTARAQTALMYVGKAKRASEKTKAAPAPQVMAPVQAPVAAPAATPAPAAK